MQKKHLVFDIETIPQGPEQLTELQKEKIAEKIERSDYWKNDTRKEMALSPWFGRIISIGLFFPEEGRSLNITSEDEAYIIKEFWKEINGFNGTFISYNGLGFDVQFIRIRSMIHRVDPTNDNFLKSHRYQSYPHFDVAMHISDWEFRTRVGLDLVCESLGIPSPKDGDVKASTVYEAYLRGKLKEIGEYCEEDLKATFEVFKILRSYRA